METILNPTTNLLIDPNDKGACLDSLTLPDFVGQVYTHFVPKKESFWLSKKSTTFNFDQIYLTKY
jgi:hypothetical protein